MNLVELGTANVTLLNQSLTTINAQWSATKKYGLTEFEVKLFKTLADGQVDNATNSQMIQVIKLFCDTLSQFTYLS